MKNSGIEVSNSNSQTKIHNEITNLSSLEDSPPFTSRRDGVLWGNNENRRDDYEEEKLILELKYIFQKSHRSSNDTEIILKYLSTLSGLVDLCKQNSDNFQQLLSNIASIIKYENVTKNRLLFKVGDDGDKFFVIFKGKVSVLVPQCESVEMNEEEYMTYLAKLRRNDEQELITKCLTMNYEVFPIDKDNFDTHLEKFYAKIWLDRKLDLIKLNNEEEEDRHTSIFNAKNEISCTLAILNDKKRKFSSKRVLTFKDLQPLDCLNILYTQVKSVEHYINETSPLILINKSRGLKKIVNVFIYTYIKDYEKGDKFGEIALQNISGKRAAALITVEDCHFGILDKSSFDQCLNQIYDKMKKGNINLLMSTKIFYGWNKNMFVRHIYEFFSHHKVDRNHVLLQENEENSFVYFLKEGEFEFKTKRSLVEINNIVKILGGNITDENRGLEAKDFSQYNKFMNEKRSIRISIVRNSDVLGLDDCLLDGKNIFTVSCISYKGEYFKIEYDFLMKYILKEKHLAENAKEFISLKRKYLVDKLKAFKEMRLKMYHDLHSNSFINKKERIQNEIKLNSILKENMKKNIFQRINGNICNSMVLPLPKTLKTPRILNQHVVNYTSFEHTEKSNRILNNNYNSPKKIENIIEKKFKGEGSFSDIKNHSKEISFKEYNVEILANSMIRKMVQFNKTFQNVNSDINLSQEKSNDQKNSQIKSIKYKNYENELTFSPINEIPDMKKSIRILKPFRNKIVNNSMEENVEDMNDPYPQHADSQVSTIGSILLHKYHPKLNSVLSNFSQTKLKISIPKYSSLSTLKNQTLNTSSNLNENLINEKISTNLSNSNLLSPEQSDGLYKKSKDIHKVPVLDCLVMDNFNRSFNFDFYFSNILKNKLLMNSTFINNSYNIQSPKSFRSSKGQQSEKNINSSNRKECNINSLITTNYINNTRSIPKNNENKYEFLVSDESIYKNNIPKIPEIPVSQYIARPSNLKFLSKSRNDQKFHNIYSNVIKKNKILIKIQKNKLGPISSIN